MQWIDKYRSKKLVDLVLSDNLKALIQTYLNEKTIPNLMLEGSPGIGKTSLADVIINELEIESILYINASEERGIDTVRDRILTFANAQSIDGNLKIIVLDECDSITNDAQAALRNIIEKACDDTRFIFTCNNINKMIPALISRCTPLKLTFSIKDVASLVVKILKDQKVEVNKEIFKNICEDIIKPNFPDIRKTLKKLELTCISKKYCPMIQVNESKTSTFILENLSKLTSIGLRTHWIQHCEDFNNDYESLLNELFQLFLRQNLSSDELDQIVVLVAQSLFNMTAVSDKELQFFSTIVQIKRVISQ